MVKNTISYIFILLCITLFYLGSSEKNIAKISFFKYNTNSIFGSDKYKFGDLYGMSYYPGIKEPLGGDSLEIQPLKLTAPKTNNLYLIHDSYLGERFFKSKDDLIGVNNVYDIEYPWCYWRSK